MIMNDVKFFIWGRVVKGKIFKIFVLFFSIQIFVL